MEALQAKHNQKNYKIIMKSYLSLIPISARVRRAVRIGAFPIEISLGTHHAVSARKNLILMTGSFVLSIMEFC